MSSKKFVAPDRPEGAATMDIAQLKEMNISALTHEPTPILQASPEQVPFRPPIEGDGDLQESIMN